ncbi:MAG: ABC transporter ATP-binding protein/permease [Myxococcales bacterium]|nr:ABC transporter ATP-binding protein/permease [Myxococcales bacterium]
MGWGGGPPAGSPFGGQNSTQSARAAGLPFAGIPPELAERVKQIEGREPEHPEPEVDFRPGEYDREPFGLWRFLSPHRGGLLMAFFLVVVATGASQAGPRLLAWAIDHGILENNFQVLLYAFFGYLAAIVASMIASYARIRYTGRLGHRLMYRLRVKVFSHLQRLSLDFYTGERAGRLITRMTSDIEALANLFQDGLVNLMVQGLTLVVITVVLLLMNVKLTLIMLLAVVPAMVVATVWFTRASDRGYAAVRDRIADVLTDLSESLSGIRLITAFNRRTHNVIHHRNVVGAHFDANVHMAKVGAVYGPATDIIGLVGQLTMLLLGGRMVASGELRLGELTAFILYLTAFFAPIQALVQLYNTYQSGQAAVKKLRDLLGTRPSVEQKPGAVELPPIEGHIELKGVSFGYDNDKRVLEQVDLTIEPGETIALVGPTGAGKSTVAKLIVRFYDPQEGSISIDGHDLRDVTLKSLRSQLGVVPQEPFLFHGSIRDNVTFARPDAGDEEVNAACEAVGLDEVVARMPRGLDSPCFERGASLSAGERQLIALARAFLARPRVLVLDEATSNVDMRSEAQVEKALDNLLGGRTAIVIAHRLATARRASRIAVIDEGKVMELGTHQELVERGGRYAEMYATWTAGVEGGAHHNGDKPADPALVANPAAQ